MHVILSVVQVLGIFFFLGKQEELVDMLRSILAQLEYRRQVCTWDEKGVPFRMYMYVPEVHKVTNSAFHEREDFAHVLKV